MTLPALPPGCNGDGLAAETSIVRPPAIRVSNLGKLFRIGVRNRSAGTLREALSDLPSFFRRWSVPTSRQQFWALKEVSFEVQEGEVVGVIGANEAGKSTLLKILSRISEPTTGTARLRGRVASLLEVGTGFHRELTGLENIYLSGAILGMRRGEIRRKVDEIVAFAGIDQFLDTPVKHYSSGMYVRLAFAVAAYLEPDILLVDEVLAVGDAEFQKRCLKRMNKAGQDGRTVLFVSHNMSAVRKLCSRAILLDSGRIVETGDSFSVTETYLKNLSTDTCGKPSPPAGFLFAQQPAVDRKFAITAIQMLDAAGGPLSVLGTWDYVRFRIYFSATERSQRGSVVFKIQTNDNTPILLCSTQPDSTLPLPIETGTQAVDCVFPSWPLAEGRYTVGAGLAIPTVEYLAWEENLCQLETVGRDVFRSGLAPSSDRYLVAAPHYWETASASLSAPDQEPTEIEMPEIQYAH